MPCVEGHYCSHGSSNSFSIGKHPFFICEIEHKNSAKKIKKALKNQGFSGRYLFCRPLMAEKERFRTQACAEVLCKFVNYCYAHALATPLLAAFAEHCIMHFYHEKIKVSPCGNTFIFWLITVILIQKPRFLSKWQIHFNGSFFTAERRISINLQFPCDHLQRHNHKLFFRMNPLP